MHIIYVYTYMSYVNINVEVPQFTMSSCYINLLSNPCEGTTSYVLGWVVLPLTICTVHIYM